MSDSIAEFMIQQPVDVRYRWCESSRCACIGCINRSAGILSNGFTKKEWEEWVENSPEPGGVSFYNVFYDKE